MFSSLVYLLQHPNGPDVLLWLFRAGLYIAGASFTRARVRKPLDRAYCSVFFYFGLVATLLSHPIPGLPTAPAPLSSLVYLLGLGSLLAALFRSGGILRR